MQVKFRSYCHSQNHNMRSRYKEEQASGALLGSQGLIDNMTV